MKIRASRISVSIARAISRNVVAKSSITRDVLRRVLQFFALFKLLLARYRPDDFAALRRDAWELDDDEYTDSFQSPQQAGGSRKGKENESELVPVGDLGYSGSTFFTTPNSKYLIKSLPRRFEHEYFTHDLFDAYLEHMKANPESLLVRITDMVYTPQATLGGIMGMAPTHHIVMENLLYGKELEESDARKKRWETYDLKPNSYFFPERDIADGKLAPESVKDKLVDEFPDRVRVTLEQKKELLDVLEADTKLLADNLAVDYSLFLVRHPGPNATEGGNSVPPTVKSRANAWRSGIDDVEGNWTYRVVVLDFFWAKHKLRAKAMTALVKTFNLIARKGPMSITADPQEYRERFMKMVDEIVIAQSY
ncbi:putative phosphatidylinositol phosphate kinase [Paramyrothecium foliicola]|nr:putative phosphatidylinositol phosphate kinase [Paramyrothecium foliicola]